MKHVGLIRMDESRVLIVLSEYSSRGWEGETTGEFGKLVRGKCQGGAIVVIKRMIGLVIPFISSLLLFIPCKTF